MNLLNTEPKYVAINRSKDHAMALYELLKEREFNISHNNLPSFEIHYNFVVKNPYRYWYLVKVNCHYVGTLYVLKDNSIGIFFLRDYEYLIEKSILWILNTKKPLSGIKSVRSSYFHINLAPKNNLYRSIAEKIGGKLIQVTYTFQ